MSFRTFQVHTSEGDWQKPLQRVMLFMALAPHTNELSDMIHRVAADKRIEELPACQQLVKYFTQQEIVPWPLPEEAALKPLAVFSGISDTEEKADEGEDAETTAKRGDEWWAMLHRRVTEHSIRVVSKYVEEKGREGKRREEKRREGKRREEKRMEEESRTHPTIGIRP